MDFYISDLHFGHAAVLELCKRPFKDISEMNEALVANWNAAVGARDTVYVVGDLFYRSETDPEDILRRLKGKKYLILGNHDKDWTGRVDLSKYFEDVRDIITVNCGRGNATLCHFPMLFFEGFSKGNIIFTDTYTHAKISRTKTHCIRWKTPLTPART